jgi:hypothetical protein
MLSDATAQLLQNRLTELNVLDPAAPFTLVSRGDNWALYISGAGSLRYGVKHFTAVQGGPPAPASRRVTDRAAAEAAGLRTFEPRGLAPRLIWEGDLPDSPGGSAVVYHWAEGNTIGQRALSAQAIDLYARALISIHSEQVELELVSPRPRNLEEWWYETHERYRDLPPELIDDLPGLLRDDLVGLVQAIAGDVQTHKRYWQVASLLPVHGYPLTHNVLIKDGRLILFDWQRFGLGDPSYEVGLVSGMMARFAGLEATDRLVARYLDSVEDQTLSPRIELYRRVWPFSRLLYLLASSWNLAHGHGRAGTPPTTLLYWSRGLRFQLGRCLQTYGWSHAAVERTLDATGPWLDALAKRGKA